MIADRRHRVTFQNPTTTADADGGYTQTWTDVLPGSWKVSIAPASPNDLERFTAGTVITQVSHLVKGRFLADVTTATRFTFKGRTFAVVGTRNLDERSISMELLAVAYAVSASVRWYGLDELRAGLKRMTTDLTREAAAEIRPISRAMRDEIRSKYSGIGTGNLAAHVVEQPAKTNRPGVVAYEVRSTARHGWIFEHGTRPRRTKSGANRGFMPAADLYIKTAIRYRARLNDALVAVVERAGFEVRNG